MNGRTGAAAADEPVSDEVSILIVDDVAANRLALRLLLRGPGRRILEAVSGTHALRILLAQDVSVILLDIEMPDMDGFETADLIRGSSRLQHVPIIFQSAYGSNSRVIKGYGLGAVDFIQKPIVAEILQFRVDTFLSLQRKSLELERTSARLARSEARSRSILETATDGIITVDQGGIVEMFNPAAARMFGYTAAEIVGDTADAILIDPDSSDPIFGDDSTFLLVGVTREALGRHRDGTTFPLGISVSTAESDGEFFFSATMRDLTEAKKVEERLTRMAQYDYLTGLANRVTLEDRLQQALLRKQQYDGNGALLYLDLDRFKSVNDQYGHRIGDLLLQSASRRLEGVLRATGLLARLGGDEFCALVNHFDDDEAITVIAERVVKALRTPFELEEHVIEISASVGIAVFRPGEDSSADVTLRADRAMYAAKRLGGDQFAHPDESGGRAAPTFVEEVTQALRTDAFVLHYQPIVSLEDHYTVGLEALLRWNRAGVGLTTPKSFMRAAEASGMILPIGHWMIEHALHHASLMAPEPKPPNISINLSLPELSDPGLAAFVAKSLRASGINPARVCFEISESAFFTDWAEAQDQSRRLRALGVKIAIDQFGLNHGSLSALTEISCDVIKLDRSLIVSLDSASSQPHAVVASIVNVSHEFGKTVIANGVERQAQCDLLRALGCDQAQGLLFAEPKSAHAPGHWLWQPTVHSKESELSPTEYPDMATATSTAP